MTLMSKQPSIELALHSADRKPIQKGLADYHWQFASFAVAFGIWTSVNLWTWFHSSSLNVVSAFVAIAWTLPIGTSVIGLYGAWRAYWTLQPMRRRFGEAVLPVSERLIVVIPTIGRLDTLPALRRVVESARESLRPHFPRLSIDLVVEDMCPAQAQINALASGTPELRILTVPVSFETYHGTRFKARANCFADLQRTLRGETCPDVWVLHMDDDTGLAPDTASEVARFIHDQNARGSEALDLAQGILCYPRELAPNRLIWLADAVRPGCDISLFSALTGSGSPRAGLHGEMLLIRASVEAEIGWDYGPRTLVEDADFALRFCARHPGRSGWIPARSYGASPATVSDFVRQRARWVWGLLALVADHERPGVPGVDRRRRALMLHNTIVWACSPLCHPGFVLLLCTVTGTFETAPLSAVLIPLWTTNIAFWIWLYWEGLKLNALSSAHARRVWWEPVLLVLLMPVYSTWEVVGVLHGVWSFLFAPEPRFNVIAKPV